MGGLAVLSTASLEAACADGPKTLVIGASRAGCAYALVHPAETLLLERGILPAAECGPAETDVWAARLLEAGCRVLLDAELARIDPLPAGGFRAVAYGLDGRHVFDVAAVKDLSVKGWHKGEWR